MIAYLKGKIKFKSSYLIVDVNNIGYKIVVAINILNKKKLNEEIELFIHEHLREDADDLYGFSTMAELNFFEQLLSVSGVGPKSALAIVSRFEIEQVKKSIVQEDTSLLTKVSGIGKKTAERIIVELKNKLEVSANISYQGKMQIDDEAIDALLSLGYNKAQAVKALQNMAADLSLEDKIRQALKNI